MSATIEERIQQGLVLESEGTEALAIDYFLSLARQFPNDAQVIFETGGAFDFAGQEKSAIPYYRRAIELGLSEENQLRVTVQLGSSLRNIGKYEEAVHLLQEGCARFPEHRGLRAFYSLALFSNGQHAEALAEMIELTLRAPEFYERYTRALTGYSAELRENPTGRR